jgi:hypothetical protein
MHNIQFVIYITFNMFTKAQNLETQDGYRVQSNFHVHISVPKLRIMQFLGRTNVNDSKMLQPHIYEILNKSTLL